MKYLILIVLVLFVGCKNSDEDRNGHVTKYSMLGPPPQAYHVSIQGPSLIKKIIIKNATLRIIVDNYEESFKKVKKIVEETKGYIYKSNVYSNHQNAKSGTIEIKVPAENLEAFIEKVKAISIMVKSEGITSADHTEEYIDISTRLINKRALENRYREILKSANTTKDILDVESQLSIIRTDIESIEKRVKYLEESSAMSEVSLEIDEPQIDNRIGESISDKIGNGFIFGYRGFFTVLGETITFLISAIPLITIVYLLFIIIKIFRKKRKTKVNIN
ncbi:MAG: hypothetical protein COW85_08425 [Ignavibacteria bacterium CG22_combo_CG10-13_8_21_14_all_37_15]|nr:DUF4349 domain-containing protein [Ignavibacteria bacterium]PIP77512.1 MAG: hypothetical protein COW85_08425 [Ignavibacteria bacterium CG22_combo_CG10-13_8_21_14_all_37_15]PIS43716.1 MAG: hypothetical protein COT22_14380 [Ignavibacteria bacterium CG08_land_8_20_14_0_20_37_9]